MFSDSDDGLIYDKQQEIESLKIDVKLLQLEIRYKDAGHATIQSELKKLKREYEELVCYHKNMMLLRAQVVG